MPAFPHSICAIRFGDHAEQPSPVVVRSEVERGVPRQRRMAADSLVAVPCTFLFKSQANAAAFETWFFGEALAGGGWFNFTLPRTGQVVTAQVRNGDIGALKPRSPDWEWSERSVVLEYVRPGFRTLPPGLHSVTPAQVMQVQRASTGTFVDAAGVLQTAAAHVARYTYFSGKNIYSGPVDLVAGPGFYDAAHALKTAVNNPANLQPGETITVSAQIYQDAASLADGVGRVAELYVWAANSGGIWQVAAALTGASVQPSGRLSASLTLPALASGMDSIGIGVYHIGGNGTWLGTVRADAIMVERGAVATAYEPGARLLVEPEGTNLVAYSQDLSVLSVWGGLADVTSAPDVYRGYAPFWTITKVSQEAWDANQFLGAIAAGSMRTMTVALLAGNVSTADVGLNSSADGWGTVPDVQFDIVEGPGTAVASPFGPSLLRVSNLSAAVPTLVRMTRRFAVAGYYGFYIFPDTASSVLIGGSIKATRVQVGATDGSYIPTTATPATRAADVIQVTA